MSVEIKKYNIFEAELNHIDKRLNKSIKWVEKNRNKIDDKISFIQAIELYDMSIDVTQIKLNIL